MSLANFLFMFRILLITVLFFASAQQGWAWGKVDVQVKDAPAAVVVALSETALAAVECCEEAPVAEQSTSHCKSSDCKAVIASLSTAVSKKSTSGVPQGARTRSSVTTFVETGPPKS